MSTAQLVTGATFTQIAKQRIIPFRDQLVGSYLFGGSAAESCKNRANPALPLVEVGVISALNRIANGSGGTDGTYNLIFTGGGPATAATGTFTVTAGAISAVTLSTKGNRYLSAPTVSTANCPGLVGANVTATRSAPTYNTNSALIKPHATLGFGFQTGIIPDEDYTWMLIRKNGTDVNGVPLVMAMPTLSGGRIYALRERLPNNYGGAGESSAVDTTGSCYRTAPAAGVIYFEAIVHNRAGFNRYYYGAGGVLNTAPNAAAGVALGGRNTAPNIPTYSQVLIGTDGLTDGITTNTVEVFAAAIVNRGCTLAEIDATYAAYKNYFATKSVTVV